MRCIISKERIAFCAQVEGSWGEVLQRHPSHCNPGASMYPINRFQCMVTVGHNTRVYHQNMRPTEQAEMVTLWSEGDVQRDALYWRRAQSKPQPGCGWWLWWSASTLIQQFRPDGSYIYWYKDVFTAYRMSTATDNITHVHMKIVKMPLKAEHAIEHDKRCQTWWSSFTCPNGTPKSRGEKNLQEVNNSTVHERIIFDFVKIHLLLHYE